MVCATLWLRPLEREWPVAKIQVPANKANKGDRAVCAENPDVSAVDAYVYSKRGERNDGLGLPDKVVERLASIGRRRRRVACSSAERRNAYGQYRSRPAAPSARSALARGGCLGHRSTAVRARSDVAMMHHRCPCRGSSLSVERLWLEQSAVFDRI